ncbi:helix-turn-helix domain-containing protein [Mucilaginibacter sp. FT3.2]|uniref:helix-turn-helix domain-containing protein n=1 Tax=Mucilaginibacter sp. FT3.2 TaxID=2723090 RepID=UPI0016189322|nr:helix-turn-helix transcriptional regulator [Mucilaginibacter sp. FT3.2]MBB6234164.1 transcriptional regulator with XRE-family HTH domain [Mucilaginibacter sp. FT3.2]
MKRFLEDNENRISVLKEFITMNYLIEQNKGERIFGKNVRNMRNKRGWSLKDMAGKIDISIAAVSKIETGFTDISLSRMEQIARVLGVDVTALLVKNMQMELIDISFYGELQKELSERQKEILKLQRKVIDLYEELQKVPKVSTSSFYKK